MDAVHFYEMPMETNTPTSNSASLVENGVHFKRPCIAVADLERSLTIYRDLLGFKLVYVSEASPQSYLYSVFGFPENAKLKFAALSTEYEPRAIALTEVQGIELPPPSKPRRLGLVIRVANLKQTIDKIRQLGLEVIEANSFSTSEELMFTEQGFCDYDGHLIILYQVDRTNNIVSI